MIQKSKTSIYKHLYEMKFYLLIFCFVSIAFQSSAQSDPYSDRPKPTAEDLQLAYPADTSVRAIVLDESGYAAIINADDGSHELEFKFIRRVKILKAGGADLASVQVVLYKDGFDYQDRLTDVAGTCYNLVNGEVTESKLLVKDVFTLNSGKYYNKARFSIPGARAGSIVEYRYTVHSPFIGRFQPWVFQEDIPKLKSVFTARIPASYTYRASLKGLKKLDIQSSGIIRACLQFNGGTADCSELVYGMTNIPAFVKEAYMSAADDYISKIDFELSSMLVNGAYTKKITETWKDEDRYMQQHEDFGLAMKRMTSFLKPVLDTLIKSKDTDSAKARQIYSLLRKRLSWNKIYSVYSEQSPKKIWETGTGTSGELNLALISGLRAAGLNASPVLLSIRSSGSPRKIFPVRSDFNNTIAALDLDGKRYFLDITDHNLSFGLIDPDNLSHEGRLFPAGDSSRWVKIVFPAISKVYSRFDLKLGTDGSLKGSVIEYTYGYNALEEKKRRRRYTTEDDYLDARAKGWQNVHIKAFTSSGMDVPEDVLQNNFTIESVNYHHSQPGKISLSPFMSSTFKTHLFGAQERLYPVDLGFPVNETVTVDIEIPAGYKVIEQPADLSIRLPDNGGFFIMSQEIAGNKYQLLYRFSLAKDVYPASDYLVLKEFMAEIVKTQQKFLVLEHE